MLSGNHDLLRSKQVECARQEPCVCDNVSPQLAGKGAEERRSRDPCSAPRPESVPSATRLASMMPLALGVASSLPGRRRTMTSRVSSAEVAYPPPALDPVVVVEHVDPRLRLREIARLVRRLVEAQRGPDHVGVVARRRRRLGLAVAIGVQQAAVRRSCASATKSKARLASVEPVGSVEHDGRRAPARRSSARSSRPAPCRPSRGGRAWRARRAAWRAVVRAGASSARSASCQRAEPVEDGVAFPVAVGGDVVDLGEIAAVLLAQHAQRSRPASRRRTCLPRPRESASSEAAKPPPSAIISRSSQATVSAMRVLKSGEPRLAIDLGHQVDEQRVVVEHLLEVRHQPALVDRVAREAAAEVIVDAALADVVERHAPRPRGPARCRSGCRRARAARRSSTAETSARPAGRRAPDRRPAPCAP